MTSPWQKHDKETLRYEGEAETIINMIDVALVNPLLVSITVTRAEDT